jgi:DnaK suppressor protein
MSISHRLHINLVVIRVRPKPFDEHDLTPIVDRRSLRGNRALLNNVLYSANPLSASGRRWRSPWSFAPHYFIHARSLADDLQATDLQRYKRLLLEKQRKISSLLLGARAPMPAAGDWEGDLMDQANADAEAELQVVLHQTEGRLLRAIEEALARMRRGTYGVCTLGRSPISKARLEAVPWTHLCRECKEQKHPAA